MNYFLRLKRFLWSRFVRKASVETVPPPVLSPAIPAAPRREPSPARKEAARIAKLRREIADKSNFLLDLFMSPKLRRFDDKRGGNDAREAVNETIGDFFCIEFADEMPGGSKWLALRPEEEDTREFAETMWPLNIGTVMRHDDGRNSQHGGEWEFLRIRTASAQELRGRIRIVPPKIVLMSNVKFFDDGAWYGETLPLGLIGNKWVPLDTNMERSRKIGSIDGTEAVCSRLVSDQVRDQCTLTVSMSCSVALTERYNWHAALGPPDGARLLLPTNPSGCLDLFKNRQKGSTERRRSALRHWVGNHFREAGQIGLSYVRDHLRGATHFNWYDLSCDLMVSDFDLEKNEVFQLEAEKWRRNRQNNRVRVRIKR